jgi:hypothetical protein
MKYYVYVIRLDDAVLKSRKFRRRNPDVNMNLPKLEREEIDGVRYYKIPGEHNLSRLVSITSVTSFHNKHIFENWRKKVGEEMGVRKELKDTVEKLEKKIKST